MKIDEYGAHPQTLDEFVAFASGKFDGEYDYNTSAESALDVTIAAFNLAAHNLGLSGFQASWIALTMLGRVNGYDGPYGVLKAEDMVFPQYDVEARAREMVDGWRPWAAEQAAKKLAESEGDDRVHPDVRAHWEALAAEMTQSQD